MLKKVRSAGQAAVFGHRAQFLRVCIPSHFSGARGIAPPGGTLLGSMRFARMRAHRFSQSSTIDRITYDEAARTLCIVFHGTGKYIYEGVPLALFETFCRSSSPGSFFNERIKERYRFRRDPERRRFGPHA